MKTEFKIPNHDVAMSEHPFALWLKNRYSYGDSFVWFEAAIDWLESLGFNRDKHKAEPGVFSELKYIAEYFIHTLSPGGDKAYTIDELFSPALYGERFYIHGHSDKVTLKPTLVELLEQLQGLVYGLKPQNYYFEIIDNRLYIKYQQILGSRKVCNIAK